MIEQIIASFIGTLLAGLVLIIPVIGYVKKKIDNYDPMGAVFD